jgi:hypothetical protein
MTTSAAKYHSCSYCSAFILDVDNAHYHGESKPESETVNEALIFSNMSLSDIQRGSSASCHFCQWLVSEWRLYDEGEYNGLIGQGDAVFLYGLTYSTSLLNRFPMDEIEFFGLWDGRRLGSSASPRCLIRTRAPIDVLTLKGSFNSSLSNVNSRRAAETDHDGMF